MSTPSLARGVLLLARGDRLVVEQVGGAGDDALSTPCSRRTRFQIASISKQMTAAAVLLLAERQTLDVTDPVERWVPDCPPEWRGITLHHLLNHTSGLGHWEDYPLIDLARRTGPVELRALFRNVPPLFRPGARWHYSSPGYVLLAHAVERAAGRPYADFLAAEVFAPLGMTDSFAGAPGDRPDVAVGHSAGRPVPSWDLDMVNVGAGDVWCSADDLLTWLDVPRRGRLLTTASVARMTTAYAPTGSAGTAYGYGCFLGPLAGERAVHHSGENAGFRSFAAWLPDSDRRLVLLTNEDTAALSLVDQVLTAA
ncbi:beta-lactamase family protein [Micromonospora sp. R77]|uniref:serine hydrolase domain-containing protein n=1 Tax=Micromonospora sp. R77 TaxID=2925836 RepID=UPI001F61D01A|nr:serine hydrolase domain-containing protein [Micromonospora sp. R77]MCI4064718.1 beta-lactamase family protein [Micromonospora sp. R77]